MLAIARGETRGASDEGIRHAVITAYEAREYYAAACTAMLAYERDPQAAHKSPGMMSYFASCSVVLAAGSAGVDATELREHRWTELRSSGSMRH